MRIDFKQFIEQYPLFEEPWSIYMIKNSKNSESSSKSKKKYFKMFAGNQFNVSSSVMQYKSKLLCIYWIIIPLFL